METFGFETVRVAARALMTSDYDTLSALFLHRFLPIMALSVDDVQRAAHLARIEITAAEAVDVQNKLEGVFQMIERMRAVDTTGIVPMSHAQDVMLPLREDRVSESDPQCSQRALYQSNAPAVEDGLYLVPKVIE
jgi:aspartyl-tRNA(Asn)/glutamyl-tRNA(Gln) amidotransferase subunit C